MKSKNKIGYKIVGFLAIVLMVVAKVTAHTAMAFHEEMPNMEAPIDTLKAVDTTLRFPIPKNTGNPIADSKAPKNMDIGDPNNYEKKIEYDPVTKRYYVTEKIGNNYYRTPTYYTEEEYLKYKAQQDEEAYWRRRLDALTLFNKKPKMPNMYKTGLFDRIFGNNTISVRPQGNVDITLGGNWQNIKNPTLVQRAQKYGVFDFDMQMNISLLAQIGDKMKLNISNNTKATFDYQNVQKLDYSGKEDDVLKKIEAGNTSFPLNSSLISGVQSLFGLKMQLQFGRLWLTGVVSQQKSKRQSLTIQGGSQTTPISIKADDYEENRHFLLGQYFHNHYNYALAEFPVIRSLVSLNKIEIWVSNKNGSTEGVRDVLALMDLGEKTPYQTAFTNNATPIQPNNSANSLYSQLVQNPNSRKQYQATIVAQSLGLTEGIDFERNTVRKLNPTEFSFNSQLGYISLNTQLNPGDILCAAYRYTYNGKVYQVGEFAEDLPPDSTNQKVLFMKLLKGQSNKPTLPTWQLMMKNIYALGGYGITKDEFKLNIMYQDPGGTEKRYLPEGVKAGTPLLTILNLDRLNAQSDPHPDGVFDYIDGITINQQQGKVIFPVIEPFGRDLIPAIGADPLLLKKYLYNILYDSTKTIARQFQQYNRFIMKGSFKSTSSSELFLGGFNIPIGSVSVTAGGQKLVENVDYQIDYGLGRLKIINSGALNSGIPINVQYEDNATFGFQQQNFKGLHFDYYFNPKLTFGGTLMRLSERPFTTKTSYGDDPIKNTVGGVDLKYQNELPGLTRLLDKLPIYSTTAPSFINAGAEIAGIFPGHPKQINSLDGAAGAVYIDDFEGTRSSYDLKFPANAWSIASTPVGARYKSNAILFPEATLNNQLEYGFNRARLAWYSIEPTLVEPSSGIPGYVKTDPLQHYIRLVQQQDVFPQKSYASLQNSLSTLDLAFFPKEKGPYNFATTNIDANGHLLNPQTRWGGIMRALDNSDFEASNVEYIEFWMLDPFINNNNNSGSLYLNLGNVSEDILKDSRKSFENGIPYPKNKNSLDSSVWGYAPRFQQQITRAFDNDPAARAVQDVGYDELNDDEEKDFYKTYLDKLVTTYGNTSIAYLNAFNDPSGDNYHYYRGSDYDNQNLTIIDRYKYYNNPQGNSPVPSANATTVSSSTTIPESEDINRDNTLNESEDYYQYRVDLKPNMQVGTNFIVNKQPAYVKLPNGSYEYENWYQFKIPIREYEQIVGNISDFRSIRFMRMFLNGFNDSTVIRFAQLDFGRNQWRRYNFSLMNPGENIPDNELKTTDFTVTSVSLEENSKRDPVIYVMPPGVDRQNAAVSNGQNVQLNEQALSLQVCGLKDGDARAAFKEVSTDLRQFDRIKMFIHGESVKGQPSLKDGDIRAFIRVGSDFINNYYEYQIPLKITLPGSTSANDIWPDRNQLNVALNDLVATKTERNSKGIPFNIPYQKMDGLGNIIKVVGNPNIGESKTMMLGILNPKREATTPNDDGQNKCAEVWFNELRVTGLNEKPAYAATGHVNVQLADLGSMHVGGSMHSEGYGNIDQKLNQRQKDNFTQYDATTNLNVGKLFPKKWGIQMPVYIGHSQSVSNPKFNPYDLDVKYSDAINNAKDAAARDSIKKMAQDYTSITSFNVSNFKITGNPEKPKKHLLPWSIKNFDMSYAYNRQFKRNPTIQGDEYTNNQLGLNYSYPIKSKPIEPFKWLIHSKSKYLNLIKDFNFNLIPSNISFHSNIRKIYEETQVRNIGEAGYVIAPTYFKNFTWSRSYNLRWELTKSLSFDYNANNNSRIDEPYGKANTAEKKDSIWKAIKTMGRNTLFTQSLNASYAFPLNKFPLTDWITLRVNYGTTYNWTAASQLMKSQGNTLANTQTKAVNGDLNFTQLYNKNRWLKAVIQNKIRTPKAPKSASNNNFNESIKKGGNTDMMDKVADSKTGNNQQKAENLPKEKPKKEEDKKTTKNETKSNSTTAPQDKNKRPETINLNGVLVVTANMTDHQIDSLRKIQIQLDLEKERLEREKKRKERKLAKINRKNTLPKVSTLERTVGRLLTMIKRASFNYSENAGTTLPGYMDSTRMLGINTTNFSPGLGYVFGYQPTQKWLEQQGANRKLSTDTLFNGHFQQMFSNNLNITAQLEPIPGDLRIDLSLNRTFNKSHNELFKDTLGGDNFQHLNPYENGTFSMTYIGLKTMFNGNGMGGKAYQNLIAYRPIISHRLGSNNPYTNNAPDPNDPAYSKGYNRFSQDVLIPSFIAAYSGKSPEKVALIDYSNTQSSSNPFKYYFPLPNWKVSYNGLSKLPLFESIFNNFMVNHAYTGTLALGSFNRSLFYQDFFSAGFPSFIDSISGNYIPYFQVPNITLTEAFSPLISFDAAFKNGLSTRFEYRKNRTVSLSLVDYQVAETRGSEFVIGAGIRVKKLKLPFAIFGVKRLENDLNIKFDLGIRDDKTTNSFLAQNVEVISRGAKVITLSPSVDYMVNEKLTLRFFYDRRRSIPYISTAFPTTTTRAGVTLRFIFAQ